MTVTQPTTTAALQFVEYNYNFVGMANWRGEMDRSVTTAIRPRETAATIVRSKTASSALSTRKDTHQCVFLTLITIHKSAEMLSFSGLKNAMTVGLRPTTMGVLHSVS